MQKSPISLAPIELPRVHQVVPRDRQDVRAEPVRAGLADRSHSRQWNGNVARPYSLNLRFFTYVTLLCIMLLCNVGCELMSEA